MDTYVICGRNYGTFAYLQLVNSLIDEQLQQNGNKACRDNHVSSSLEADNKRQECEHCVEELLWVLDYKITKTNEATVSPHFFITHVSTDALQW